MQTYKPFRSAMNLSLAAKDVHIWKVTPDLPMWYLNDLKELLASDELRRANQFYFEKDRKQFIVGRGVLRSILGHYLRLSPKKIQFRYNRFGKPFLVHEGNSTVLEFNLSHSSGVVLLGFTLDRKLGIDIEKINKTIEYEKIAEKFFSPKEYLYLCKQPASRKPTDFYQCWTRKEAYMKARGQGLSIPLDSFEVSFGSNQAAKLLAIKNDFQEALNWNMQEIIPARDYIGAIAVRCRDCNYKYWQWTA